MQVPEFDADYRNARRDSFHQAVARLQQASGAAVTTLLKLAVDPNVPAAVKARAAYYILTLGTKAMETEDIDVRVTELERARGVVEAGPMNLRRRLGALERSQLGGELIVLHMLDGRTETLRGSVLELFSRARDGDRTAAT